MSAGVDLYSVEDAVVHAFDRVLVKLGIAVMCPEGYYGRLAPRSGLALKSGLHVLAGVVDADYTGELGVLLFNCSDQDVKIRHGDRVAQLICEKICYPIIQQVDTLDATSRGSDGFGSTGK